MFSEPIVRLDPITVDPPFRPGEGHNIAEFERQIQGQQNGMNNLTVEEFLRNRDAYLENGRSAEGSRAQQAYRDQFMQDRIDTNIENGMTPDQARLEAETYMSDKAALHDPDQIAGGNSTNITGLGDARVNSSIGSQWKTRIESIDAQVREQARNMTPEQMRNTRLNVNLYE